MKKLIALAVATAVMSPMVSMAAVTNVSDNVGDVTLQGDIIKQASQWQWTVNDYPGQSLDAKPSEATEANDVITYKLNGQKFIAVSGFLPSFSAVNITGKNSSSYGVADKTELLGGDGQAISNIKELPAGAVSFTIPAISKDSQGNEVQGTLQLTATEIRGQQEVARGGTDTHGIYTFVYGSTSSVLPVVDGSCFVGTSAFPDSASVVRGTGKQPMAGIQSATAFAAFTNALNQAELTGNAGLLNNFNDVTTDEAMMLGSACSKPTVTIGVPQSIVYLAAAHVLELEPTAVSFNTEVKGLWNATLTVTAYQM